MTHELVADASVTCAFSESAQVLNVAISAMSLTLLYSPLIIMDYRMRGERVRVRDALSAFAEHGANIGTKTGSGTLPVRPTPHRMLHRQLETTAITSKLEWALSYPSATAAWGSVYRHAIDGRFDMDMPQAFATVSVLDRPVGGRLLVTRLQVMTLTPAEEPHPFAAEYAKRDFIVNEGVNRRPTWSKGAAPTRDERLAASQLGSGPVPLITDEQWARMEPLLRSALQSHDPRKPGGSRTHSLREIIDVIWLKLGTPYS